MPAGSLTPAPRSGTAAAVGAGAGVLLGVAVDLGLWRGAVPIAPELTALVARPAAILVSSATGWPLEGEASIACHALGLAITVPVALGLLGAAIGAVYGWRDRATPSALGG
ncbi:MAG: hypothetical protein U0234_17560 [Sandaracinus sp.]